MATNLVSEIVEVLSPTITSRIASALGLNQTSTQKAVVAAVPALLASLISGNRLENVCFRRQGGHPCSALMSANDPKRTPLINAKTTSFLLRR